MTRNGWAARGLALTLAASGVIAAGVGWGSVAAAAPEARASVAVIHPAPTGGVSKATYDREMKRIGDQFANALNIIYPLLSGTAGSTVRGPRSRT
jgi:hypothetical protein